MTDSDNSLEIEVKFYLYDIDNVRRKIIELGAESYGKFFGTNIRFEDENRTLIQKKFLLRLRKDSKTTLTFKSEPHIQDSQVKIRRELEVEISDFSVMKQILESLGFHKEQIYEKNRETLILGTTHFCIDNMPFGNFLEIEGKKEDIINFADKLGLKWEKRILTNYLGIFEIIKQKSNLHFSDITFDNFQNIKTDPCDFLFLIQEQK